MSKKEECPIADSFTKNFSPVSTDKPKVVTNFLFTVLKNCFENPRHYFHWPIFLIEYAIEFLVSNGVVDLLLEHLHNKTQVFLSG